MDKIEPNLTLSEFRPETIKDQMDTIFLACSQVLLENCEAISSADYSTGY